MKRDVARARAAIERLGITLVYPPANEREPPSLWYELHPRTRMQWSWDADADPRVAELWHLRNELSASGDVAYGKWFRGRATFFSLDVFHAMLGRIAATADPLRGLSPEAREILDLCRERSPISTKQLRADAGLQGKPFEGTFQRAMKQLWTRLLVVGTGEIEDGAFPSLAVAATELMFEDGAFPSLAVAATELMFEDVWAARAEVPAVAGARLDAALGRTPAFARAFTQGLQALTAPLTVEA